MRAMRITAALAALAAGALLLAACGSSGGSSDGGSSGAKTTTTADGSGGVGTSGEGQAAAPTVEDLDGRTFRSTKVTGYDLAPKGQVVLAFDHGRLSASGGCNNQSADYEVAKGVLRWTTQPATTQMACADDLMAQDAWLAGWLTMGVDATLDGDTLVLSGDDVEMTLEDETATGTDVPLKGTEWQLTSITSAESASSVPTDVETPTLLIGDDDSVAVFTGCNRGSSTVELSQDDTVATFSPLAMTKKACGASASQVEAAQVQVLDGRTQVALDGDQLTLTNGDQTLVYQVS